MKITPLEVKEYRFKKVFRGYDPTEVEALKALLSDVLEELTREKRQLEDESGKLKARLEDYLDRENLLRATLTTAQKVTEDIKDNAKKEAELIISEANMKAEEIIRGAHHRVLKIQEDIDQLKKQRIKIESEIKAIIEYHQKILFSEDDRRKTEEIEEGKIKYLK